MSAASGRFFDPDPQAMRCVSASSPVRIQSSAPSGVQRPLSRFCTAVPMTTSTAYSLTPAGTLRTRASDRFCGTMLSHGYRSRMSGLS